LTNEIGTGNGPVPADLVRGSVLVADGRRLPGEGQSPGLSPGNGQSMEITLQPVTGLTQLIAGATMTGPRPGGFGALADRTAQICGSRDLICNAPLNVVDGAARFQEVVTNNAIHAQYATNPDVIPGTTVPEWTLGHVTERVNQAPETPHTCAGQPAATLVAVVRSCTGRDAPTRGLAGTVRVGVCPGARCRIDQACRRVSG